jgi:hypothetical protein
VEIRHIRLTRYPWFVLARVGVCPYRIQLDPIQFVPDDALLLPAPPRRQLPASASLLFPQFCREMPLLKEMLIQSRSDYERAQ